MKPKRCVEKRTRGWLPEEPKMPKSKLKRLLTPIVVLLTATAALSLFSSTIIFGQPTAPLVVPVGAQSIPSSAYVKFKGVPSTCYVEINGTLQEVEDDFLVLFTNGSNVNTKNLAMTFSIAEKSGDEYNVKITVEGDCFLSETVVDGYISDGRLVINSMPSIFLTKTEQAEKGKQILLSETADWNLTGDVNTLTGKPSTEIDDQRIVAIMVTSSQLTESGGPLRLTLGYDPSTGILVHSGGSINDVLLKAIGIEYILGGTLEVVSYSENLNFELVADFRPGVSLTVLIFYIFLFCSPVILAIVTIVMYMVRRQRKRTLHTVNAPKLNNETQSHARLVHNNSI